MEHYENRIFQHVANNNITAGTSETRIFLAVLPAFG